MSTLEGIDENGPAPANYSNGPATEKKAGVSQREQLIPRKQIQSPNMVEQYEDLGPIPTPHRSGTAEGNKWAPGFWTSFPFRGIVALFTSLGCMGGSIAVLYRSNGQPVSDWKIYPTVYMALLMTGANMSLRLAFNQGVKISWWYHALRGSSVRRLHHQWSSGDGFWAALFSGRYFNFVSLASIATTLVVIDQPLIQRASTVVSTSISYPVNVTAHIAPEIPWGYTGFITGRASTDMVMTSAMLSAWTDYNSKNPIVSNFTGCKSTCTGFVNAAGLAAQCSTISGPVSYLLHTDNDEGNAGRDPADNYLAETAFGVEFTLVPANVTTPMNSSSIKMVVSYTNNSVGPSTQDTTQCTGFRTQRTCTLRPATIRYPVTLTKNTISLTRDYLAGSVVQSLQPPSPNVSTIDIQSPSKQWTIGGLYVAANNLFSSNGSYQFIGAAGFQLNLPDTLSAQFLQISQTKIVAQNISYPVACTTDWSDPTMYVLSGLNELAFRVSLTAAGVSYRNTSHPPAPQVLEMQETATINVFHSDYGFLLASSLLSAMFVLLVAPTFWGWWEIGRSVTLNPIEVAKAFDAPFFQGSGSNATENQLVRNTGSRLLRYGETEGYGGGEISRTQLKLAEPHEVSRPTPGTLYV